MTEVIKVNYSKAPEKKLDSQWWKLSEKEVYHHVIGACRGIENVTEYRRRRNVMHARMYGNQFLQHLNSNIYASPKQLSSQELRVSLNVVKAAVDTASSKIAKNKPRPLFLTTRGSQPQRQRAKKLTQYVDGVFTDAKIYQRTQTSFRDSGIFGTGFIKLHGDKDAGKICCERVLPDEIVVDDAEAIYGNPRTKYHRKFMPRELVLSMWGDVEIDGKPIRPLIETCEAGGGTQRPSPTQNSDMLYVVEAWHLPTSYDGSEGKHVICISNTTIVYEDYKKQYFPIIPFYWTKPVIGYYGAGIIEEIAGLQLEINKTLRDIALGQHRICSPQIWVENSTHVAKPITNEIGSINRYTGQPPVFYAPSAFSNEVYSHVWNLYRRAFEIVGISELSATLKKPAGLESRAALREYNDIETERFALVAQDWEEFHMQIADVIIDISRDLFTSNKDLSVNTPGKKFIDSIRWEDVDMDADEYVMTRYPTALLPSTPSGKLDRVQDLIDGGLIEQDEARSLLDFPDVEGVISLETASREVISMMLDRIIEDGEFTPPEQFMNLQQALKMAQNTYLRALTEDVDEDKLELIRVWIKKVLELMPPPPTTTPPLAGLGPLPDVPGPVPSLGPQPPIGPAAGPDQGPQPGPGLGAPPPLPIQ